MVHQSSCYIHYTYLIFFLVTDFLPIRNRLFANLTGSLSLLVQQRAQFLGDVENTASPLATDGTGRGLAIALQRTGFAEVMPAFGDDRLSVRVFANDASERNAFQ